MNRRRVTLLAAIGVLMVLIAVPVLAAQPSSPPGQQKDKVAKAPITLHGTIESTTAADEQAEYTLTDGGKTYTLEAGPKWFFGDNYPLKKYVGQAVTIEGEIAEGSAEVDVISVNGEALRGAGKPPWAGGWKRVGSAHPGWSQEKADRLKAKFGDCFPPGQCKDKPSRGDDGAEQSGNEPSAPETAAPETAAPETAAPETAAPETAAPESAAPESAAPETAAPESAAPESAPPESAAPESAAPEST